MERLVGDSAEFVCKAKGTPTPQFIWYKDDKPVKSDNPRYSITSADDLGSSVSSLVITDLDIEDDGTFSCEVFNEAGKDRCKMELFVDG